MLSEQSKEKIGGYVDRGVNKLISRKFLVWSAATWLLYADKLQSEHWVAVTWVFLGIQGLADIAATWKSA